MTDTPFTTGLPALPRAKELLDNWEADKQNAPEVATAYALVAIAESLAAIHNDLRDIHAATEASVHGIKGLDAELQYIRGRMR